MSATPSEPIRPIPHAPGVEKSVLSVMLQYPEKVDEAPELSADHFHMPGHRIVFETIREFSADGKSTELVGFTQHLIDSGQMDKIGGPSAIYDIYGHAATPAHFRSHIETLNFHHSRRMTIALGHEAIRVGYEASEPQDILDVTSQPITAIQEAIVGKQDAPTAKAILDGVIQRFQALCEGHEDPVGIRTSLDEINSRFRGLHPKQTIVISGYPGGGKTTLAVQLAVDAALGGHNALVISLEVTAQTIMNRVLAYVSRLPGDAITDPLRYCRENYNSDGPTNAMLSSIKRGVETINKAPIAIEDMIGANVHQITARIRRAHRKKPLAVVVVDFVQRIRPSGDMRRDTKEQQLAHASNRLADLAKELGFCLLLPSQLNKDGAAKHAEAINEDADLHLQIIQDREGKAATFAHLGLAVVKDRHAGQDGCLLPIILEKPMIRFIPKPFKS